MSVLSARGSFGNYHLESLVGRGGMGEVWLARDRTGSAVALKVLSAAYSADPGYRRRFEREAWLGTQVHNPHIVPIHAFGEVDGHLFLEMAYIEGVDLATRLRSGALVPGRAVEVIVQAAEALDAAHAAGLVHRDVKPGNILEDANGFVYLIDFGIARAAAGTALTATGLVVGTLGYMAPERFTGTAEARSDVYSLACVLYETLTGNLPYGDGDPAQQMHAHLMSEPPRASQAARGVPPALDAVIARGMAKEPGDRYTSAGEFAAAARAALGWPASAHSTSPVAAPATSGPHPRTRVMTAIDSPQHLAETRPMPQTPETRPQPRPPEPRLEPRTPETRPVPQRPETRPQPQPPEPRIHPVVHPGLRRKRLMRRWIPVAAGLALVAAAALWLLSGVLESDSVPGTTTQASSAAASTGAPPPSTGGQPPAGAVRDGNLAFTVTEVVSNVSATGAPGGSYTIVTLTVTNVSRGEQVFRIADQRLITAAGRALVPDAAATTAFSPSRAGVDQLAPNSTHTIRLAFDLPGKDKNKKNDKKVDVPSQLVLHGAPSSPGVTVPLG
ncbi:serine/threonine-protein kinase [Nocardia sp. CA-129566]|uniref:serine/threonine-protein kinase n=1 Tax=Nocardia sp. CA-129566 TaxID=3239976 RepID=UPI003D959C38